MGKTATAAIAVLLVLLFGVTLTGSSSQACTGNSKTVDVAAAAAHEPIAGFNGEKLANAALIMNAAAALNLPTKAQQIGVMTAIGESGLRNLTYGDDRYGVTNPDRTLTCSVGLFQQQWCLPGQPWGDLAQTMDPTRAATTFFTRLMGVSGWEGLDPSEAAHRVQGNADSNHYTKYFAAAQQIVTALAGGGTGCNVTAVTDDAKQLAVGLVATLDAGNLTFLEARYEQQLRAVAAGTAAANCGISVRVLQIMTIAVQTFQKVGVSDLNRQCTGSQLGAGTGSSHWMNGGGNAVDFYSLGGNALTGGDANSVQLLTVLDPIVPKGTRVGQVDCRPAPLPLKNFTEFDDTCNHLHIDVAYTDGPLTFVRGA